MGDNAASETFKPAEILGLWKPWLEQIEGSRATLLAKLVRRYCLAPHAVHFNRALSFAQADGCLDATEVQQLTGLTLESGPQPSKVAYGLFTAYVHISNKILVPERARAARQLLFSVFQVSDSECFDTSIAYNDALALRRVLVEWLSTVPEGAPVDESALVEALETEQLALSELDIRRVLSLIQGERAFAERQKSAPEAGRQSQRRRESEALLRARVTQLSDQRPKRLSDEHIDGDAQTLGVSEGACQRAGEVARAVDTSPMENLESLSRSAPAAVRFQVAARARQAVSVQSMASTLEAAILGVSQIRWAMEQLDTAIERAVVLFLLCGWSIKRLETLVVGDTTPESSKTPFIDQHRGELHYRIQVPGQTTAALEVVVALSPTLLRTLQGAGEQPFKGMGKHLNQRWQSRGRTQPGLRVTCERLTRTGRRHLWGMVEGEWEMAALSGQANLSEDVALTYRRIEPECIQNQYNAWCQQWGLAVPERMPEAPAVGSTRSMALSRLAEIQHRLAQKAVLASRHRQSSIRAFSDCVNCVTAYLAAALALVCGLRSLGQETQLAMVGERIWIREKNSKNRRESRTVTIPKRLAETLERWRARVRNALEAVGRVELNGCEVSVLPPLIRLDDESRLSVEPFRLKDWRNQVAAVCGDEYEANALRHSLATASQHRISYPLIHWLMGHHRQLEAPVHPTANVPLAFTELRDLQTALLRDIRFDSHVIDVLPPEENLQ